MVTAARVTNVFLLLLLLLLLLVLLLTGLRKSDDADVDATSNLIIVANPEIKTSVPFPQVQIPQACCKETFEERAVDVEFSHAA